MIQTYFMAEPFSLDPRVGGDYRSQTVIGELFDGLVRYNKHGEIIPSVASSIQVSPDKKQYTFVLKDTKWTNGLPVTAYDFEYAWKSILSGNVQTRHASAFFIIKNARKALNKECSIDEVGIRVLHSSILEVELEHPADYFLEWAAIPMYAPVCKAVAEKDPQWASSFGENFVCNGPYILSKHDLNQSIVLKKNYAYWDAWSVKNPGIIFSIIEDPNTAYNLFCKKELDWVGDPGGVISTEVAHNLLREEKLRVVTSGSESWIRCNVNFKPLSSPKIRKALACAINREEICTKLLSGTAFPAFSIVPRHFSALSKKLFDDHDAVMAKKFFAEGLEELQIPGSQFPPITLICQSDPRAIAIAELICEQIQKTLGITVLLKSMEPNHLMESIFQIRYELSLAGWISGLTDPIYNLSSMEEIGGQYKTTGFKNETYAALLKASDEEANSFKRKELLEKAESLLIEEMPVIPVIEQPFRFAKQSNIAGDYFTRTGRLELMYAKRLS